jgi:hypothetical protein
MDENAVKSLQNGVGGGLSNHMEIAIDFGDWANVWFV